MVYRHPIAPILTLVFAAIVAPSAQSQITYHPAEPSAILVDTLLLTMELPGDVEGTSEWGTTVWLMPDSTYGLIIDLESFVFSGPGPGIDTLSLAAIVDAAALRSVEAHIETGRLDSVGSGESVTVWVHGWGQRIGGGLLTSFAPCATNLWARIKYCVDYTGGIWHFICKSQGIDDYSGGGTCEPSVEVDPGIQ